MMMAVGSMGGKKGLTSATGAMNAIAGMATGYQQGRKEEFDRQKQIFEENYKIMKENQAQIEKEFQYALKYAQKDLSGATAKLANNLQARGMGAAAQGLTGGTETITSAHDKIVGPMKKTMSQMDQYKEKLLAAKADVTRAEEYAKTQTVKGAGRFAVIDGKQGYYTPDQLAQATTQGLKVEEVAKGKGTAGTQQAQNMITAANELKESLGAITKLQSGTTTGSLPNLETKDGLTNFIRNTVGRRLNSDEAVVLDTLQSGVGRNLAFLENNGFATGLAGLSNSLQNSTYIRSGDESIPRQAIKLAEIRKIAEAAVNAKIGSGGMSPEAAKYAQGVIDEIKQMIPFTVNDVAEAVTKVRKETGKDVLTMGEATKGFSLDNLFAPKSKQKTNTQTKIEPILSDADKQAIEFVKQNPTDLNALRIKEILRKKGVQVD